MTSIASFCSSSILPALVDTIRIPAKSPHFDPDWQKNGQTAVEVLTEGPHTGDAGGAVAESCRIAAA